jgi:hypothetical protein
VGWAPKTIIQMSTDRISPDVSDGSSPNPSPGFETDVIREVEGLFSALPSGTATLHVGRVPGHADWPEPYFEVTPTNSKAARFEGIAVADDLTLIIGEAEREFVGFARGGSIMRGASWQQELRWIWETVLAGGFAQHHYLDSLGKVIGCGGNGDGNQLPTIRYSSPNSFKYPKLGNRSL